MCYNFFDLNLHIRAIEKDDNGKIVSAVFSHPSEINTPIGKVTATGTVYFNSDGKVIEFTPVEAGIFESPVGKINYQGEIPLSFYDSGSSKAAVLSADSQIKHAKRVYPITQKITFYENWIPQSLVLSKNKAVTLPFGSVTCKGGYLMNFYPTGEIKSFYLADDAELPVASEQIKAEGEVEISKGGKILSAFITDSNGFSSNYGRVYPVSNMATTFYTDGSLKSLVSEDVIEIEIGETKVITAPNTEVLFNKNGTVQKATVIDNKISFYGWDIKLPAAGYTFIVYPNKSIFVIKCPKPVINGNKYLLSFDYSLLLNNENTHYFQPPSCRLFGRFAASKIMRVLFTFACIHFFTCGSFVNLSKYIFLPVFQQVNRMYVMLQRGLQPRRLLNITSILFRCAAMDGGTPGLRSSVWNNCSFRQIYVLCPAGATPQFFFKNYGV